MVYETVDAVAAELKLDDVQFKRLEDASAPELGYPYDFMQRLQGRWYPRAAETLSPEVPKSGSGTTR